jgi:hypothetical protein
VIRCRLLHKHTSSVGDSIQGATRGTSCWQLVNAALQSRAPEMATVQRGSRQGSCLLDVGLSFQRRSGGMKKEVQRWKKCGKRQWVSCSLLKLLLVSSFIFSGPFFVVLGELYAFSSQPLTTWPRASPRLLISLLHNCHTTLIAYRSNIAPFVPEQE